MMKRYSTLTKRHKYYNDYHSVSIVIDLTTTLLTRLFVRADVVVFVRADVVNRMSNTHTCHKKTQHTIARNRNMDTPIAGYSG
jgi:hypothetical protein